MLDHAIRNARVPGAAGGGAVDIGFAKGTIAAIEPSLAFARLSHGPAPRRNLFGRSTD
jgi:hypothetical protein